jgi:amidohydrolase
MPVPRARRRIPNKERNAMTEPAVSPAELKKQVQTVLPEIIELRHALHRIPEIHLEEFETAALIRKEVEKSGLELLPPYLETDVVGLLKGKAQGAPGSPNVTLRADMDGLPLQEKTGCAWSSVHEGRAHACGHDGHMAILVGVLRVLERLSDRLDGSVRFVFQPGEEEAGGGKLMVARGLLEADPKPAAVFAVHGWPGLPLGSVAVTPGTAMAAADTFTLTIRGKGGHGATPHKAEDPIVAGAQIITALQTIVSRSINPLLPAVVSVCSVHGGSTTNIIPDEVVMQGTTRYFERRFGELIRRRMHEIVDGICAAAGVEYNFEYLDGYIPLVNDPGQVRLAREVTETYLRGSAWLTDPPATMGAEDFAFYLDKVPGAFLRLGMGEKWKLLHHPGFDFNDRVLETGITVMAGLALESLKRAGAAG